MSNYLMSHKPKNGCCTRNKIKVTDQKHLVNKKHESGGTHTYHIFQNLLRQKRFKRIKNLKPFKNNWKSGEVVAKAEMAKLCPRGCRNVVLSLSWSAALVLLVAKYLSLLKTCSYSLCVYVKNNKF